MPIDCALSSTSGTQWALNERRLSLFRSSEIRFARRASRAIGDPLYCTVQRSSSQRFAAVSQSEAALYSTRLEFSTRRDAQTARL